MNITYDQNKREHEAIISWLTNAEFNDPYAFVFNFSRPGWNNQNLMIRKSKSRI